MSIDNLRSAPEAFALLDSVEWVQKVDLQIGDGPVMPHVVMKLNLIILTDNEHYKQPMETAVSPELYEILTQGGEYPPYAEL